MTFSLRKLNVFEASMQGMHGPRGAETLCRLSRRMPDGQCYASFFWIMEGVDRKSAAAMIRSEKDAVRRVADEQWKPTTTKPAEAGSRVKGLDMCCKLSCNRHAGFVPPGVASGE